MIYIMNSPVLTGHGVYEYSPTEVGEVKSLIEDEGFISAVGHDSTAKIISTILGINCPKNRTKVRLKENDDAVVFQLAERPPEGKILSVKEVEEIGYSVNLLSRIS